MRARILFTTFLLAAIAIASDGPKVRNGHISAVAATGTLEARIRSVAQATGPVWVGYSVPVVDGQQHMCCFNRIDRAGECCGGCRLEGKDSREGMFYGSNDECRLEPDRDFHVFLRYSAGKPDRVLALSAGCQVDLAGMALSWLGAAPPAESISLLESMALDRSLPRDKGSERALMAVAMHAGPLADRALERLAVPGKPAELRKQAAFWMGTARGRSGFDSLRRMAREEQDPSFREELAFPLSQSPVPEAQQELIRIAREDGAGNVRAQAIFWLAQKAGDKVAGVISEAVEDDPDTEVKKKAVFALSQMEDNAGVPLLINLAKTHKNPVVRKEAMFWLGESGDARALEFIESVLR